MADPLPTFKQIQKDKADKAMEADAIKFWAGFFRTALVAGALTVTWNYGVTEIIDALGGPDANVNFFVAALTVLFTRAARLEFKG